VAGARKGAVGGGIGIGIGVVRFCGAEKAIGNVEIRCGGGFGVWE